MPHPSLCRPNGETSVRQLCRLLSTMQLVFFMCLINSNHVTKKAKQTNKNPYAQSSSVNGTKSAVIKCYQLPLALQTSLCTRRSWMIGPVGNKAPRPFPRAAHLSGPSLSMHNKPLELCGCPWAAAAAARDISVPLKVTCCC